MHCLPCQQYFINLWALIGELPLIISTLLPINFSLFDFCTSVCWRISKVRGVWNASYICVDKKIIYSEVDGRVLCSLIQDGSYWSERLHCDWWNGSITQHWRVIKFDWEVNKQVKSHPNNSNMNFNPNHQLKRRSCSNYLGNLSYSFRWDLWPRKAEFHRVFAWSNALGSLQKVCHSVPIEIPQTWLTIAQCLICKFVRGAYKFFNYWRNIRVTCKKHVINVSTGSAAYYMLFARHDITWNIYLNLYFLILFRFLVQVLIMVWLRDPSCFNSTTRLHGTVTSHQNVFSISILYAYVADLNSLP